LLEDAPDTAAPTCFHHTDRPTGRRCTRCGRPACPDCLRDAAVGAHCWQCLRDAAPPRREQVRRRLASEPLIGAKALILANLAVFAVLTAQGADLMAGSFAYPADPRSDWVLNGLLVSLGGEWWRVFTSGFVHFGLLHIGFNMFILYQVALVLERLAGTRRFVLVYFVSLVTGSLGVLILDPLRFTAGASGAVFGVAGAATLLLYRHGVPFLRTGFGPLLLINLVLTFTSPAISVGGHVGGLVGGVACGLVLFRPVRSKVEAMLLDAVVLGLGVVAYWGCLYAADRSVPF
jgi:membrane associated rhomboid family serine protease